MSTTKTHTVYYNARGFSYRSDELGEHPFSWGKVITLNRTRTGSSVPKWKDKIQNHQDATSVLTGRYDSLDVRGLAEARVDYHFDVGPGYTPTATHRFEFTRGDLTSYSQSALTAPNNGTWDSSVDGRAANRFLSEVRKQVTRMSAPTFLGELKQTLHMLRHPMESLARSADAYYRELLKRKQAEKRNRRRKGLKELPKDSPLWEYLYSAPGLWLEYSFGWVPLMMDVEDALDALDSLSQKEMTVKISKGAQGAKLISQQSLGAGIPGCNRLAKKGTERILEHSLYRYRGDVISRAATTYAEKGARWGFTPTEFLPTAWELLPWSFLVDYFASIGDYLDSAFSDTTSLAWSCRTIKRTRTTETLAWIDEKQSTSSIPGSGLPVCQVFGGPARSFLKSVVVNRQPGVIPSPSLVFTFLDQSSRHLANMSALLGMFSANLHSQKTDWTHFAFRR